MKFPGGVTWHSSGLTRESVNCPYYTRLSSPRFMPGCEGIHGLRGEFISFCQRKHFFFVRRLASVRKPLLVDIFYESRRFGH
jgi:hypothetical protein